MKTKGQFYLVMAVVISVAIIGFAVVSNYIKSNNNVKLYDLGEELGFESSEVLSYGIITEGINNTELVEHFTTLHDQYAGNDKNVYYIFGNGNKVIAYEYGEFTAGRIDVTTSAGPLGLDILKRAQLPLETEYTAGNSKVTVTIDEKPYTFDLKPGENFYFVISQQTGGENYVVTG